MPKKLINQGQMTWPQLKQNQRFVQEQIKEAEQRKRENDLRFQKTERLREKR
jgi:hypothetical protein